MTRRLLVVTSYVYPPIPTRNMDWSAVTDNYEPGEPIGYGPSEGDAVADLYHQITEREDDQEEAADDRYYGKSRFSSLDPDLALEQKRDDAMLDKLHRQDDVPDDTTPF